MRCIRMAVITGLLALLVLAPRRASTMMSTPTRPPRGVDPDPAEGRTETGHGGQCPPARSPSRNTYDQPSDAASDEESQRDAEQGGGEHAVAVPGRGSDSGHW